MSRRTVKPSPNEESEFLRKERERKRLQRLVQVREQSKFFSKHIRNEYKKLCAKEVEQHESVREVEVVAKVQAEKSMLKSKLQYYVSEMGQGHQSAQDAVHDSEVSRATSKAQEEANKIKTEERFKSALKESNKSTQMTRAKRESHIRSRERALDVEKARAREVASQPPPKQDIEMHLENVKGHRVTMRSAESFACSHYSLPMHTIIKRPSHKELHGPSGVDLAEEAIHEYQQSRDDVDLHKQEQEERALMRHRHALAQIRMEKAHKEGLKELEQLERRYRSSRQQTMAELPANLFQPAQRQIDIRREKQKEMERAFEKPFLKKSGPLYATELSKGSSLLTQTVVDDWTSSEDDSSRFSQESSAATSSGQISDNTRSPSPIRRSEGIVQEEVLGSAATLTRTTPVDTLSIGNMDSHLTETISSIASEGVSTKTISSSVPGISPLSTGNIDDTEITSGETSSGSSEETIRARLPLSSEDQQHPVHHPHSHPPPVHTLDSEDLTRTSGTTAASTTLSSSVISSDDSTVQSLLSSMSLVDEDTGSDITLKGDEEGVVEEVEEENEGCESTQSVGQNGGQCSPEMLQDHQPELPLQLTGGSCHPGSLVDPHPPGHSSGCAREQSPSTSQEEHAVEDAASQMATLLAQIAHRQDAWTKESADSRRKPVSTQSYPLTEPARLGSQMKPLQEQSVQEESEVETPSTPLSVATLSSSAGLSSDMDDTQSLSSVLQGTLSWTSLQEASPQLSTFIPKPQRSPQPPSTLGSARPPGKQPVLSELPQLSLSSPHGTSHHPMLQAGQSSSATLSIAASASSHHLQGSAVIPGAVLPFSSGSLPANSVSGGFIRPTVSPSVRSQASNTSLGVSFLQDQSIAHSSLLSNMDSFDSFASLPVRPAGRVIKPTAPPPHLRQGEPASSPLAVSITSPVPDESTTQCLAPVQPPTVDSTESSISDHSTPSVADLSSRNQVSLDLYSPGLIHYVPGLSDGPASSPTLKPLPSPSVSELSDGSHRTPLAPAASSQPTPHHPATAASFGLEGSTSVPSHSDPPHQPSSGLTSAHQYPTDSLQTDSLSLSAITPLSNLSTDLPSSDWSGSLSIDSYLSQSISDQLSISSLSSLTPQSMIESLLRGNLGLSSRNAPHQDIVSVPVSRDHDVLSQPGVLPMHGSDTVPVNPAPLAAKPRAALLDLPTTAVLTPSNAYALPQVPPHSVSSWAVTRVDPLPQDLGSTILGRPEKLGPPAVEKPHVSLKNSPTARRKTSPAASQRKNSPASQAKTSPTSQSKDSPASQRKNSPASQRKNYITSQTKNSPASLRKDSPASQRKNSPRSQQSVANYRPPPGDSTSGSGLPPSVVSLPVSSHNVLTSALDLFPPAHSPSRLETGTIQLLSAGEDHSKKQISLQEAFLQKRKCFVQNSEQRRKEAKVKAAHSTESMAKSNRQVSSQSARGSSSSTHSAKSTPVAASLPSSKTKRTVTFSSPLSVQESTGQFSPPKVHNSKVLSDREHKSPLRTAPIQPHPRKMNKHEIHAVNRRLYSQLAEVRQKKAEEEKAKAYLANRTRVKEFEKKLHDARKQKKKPKTSQQINTTTKPLARKPFK